MRAPAVDYILHGAHLYICPLAAKVRVAGKHRQVEGCYILYGYK